MIIIDRNRRICEEIRQLYADGYTAAEIIARGYKPGTVKTAVKGRPRGVRLKAEAAPLDPKFKLMLNVSIETGGIREDRRKEVCPWLSAQSR